MIGRLSTLAVAGMVSLALIACGVGVTPGPEAVPGSESGEHATPTPIPVRVVPPGEGAAPPEYRLDLSNGVVVAFVYGGPSTQLWLREGRPASPEHLAFVTHVPSGSQLVLDEDARVLERHDGRGDGPELLDAVLADEELMARIGSQLREGQGPPPNAVIDWIDFIKINGITYPSSRQQILFIDPETGEREWLPQDYPVSEAHLGPELYRIAFRLDGRAGTPYRSQDGDAGFLNTGTPVYAVRGYDPSFRLAVVRDGKVTIFEAGSSVPGANQGADVLDIQGKVVRIAINGPSTANGWAGWWELASIDDPGQVEVLVEMVLAAPVNPDLESSHDEPSYSILFHLQDGTYTGARYRPGSGQFGSHMLLPQEFADAVREALAEAGE